RIETRVSGDAAAHSVGWGLRGVACRSKSVTGTALGAWRAAWGRAAVRATLSGEDVGGLGAQREVADRVRKRRDLSPRAASVIESRAMDLDRKACYRAVKARDRRFDGRFLTGVSSTGIFCRP